MAWAQFNGSRRAVRARQASVGGPVYAVCPERTHLRAAVVAFIEFVQARLR